MFLETFREETQRMREVKAVVSSKLTRSSSFINRPTFCSAASVFLCLLTFISYCINGRLRLMYFLASSICNEECKNCNVFVNEIRRSDNNILLVSIK